MPNYCPECGSDQKAIRKLIYPKGAPSYTCTSNWHVFRAPPVSALEERARRAEALVEAIEEIIKQPISAPSQIGRIKEILQKGKVKP